MAVDIGDQVVSPSKGIFAGNKAGDDVKIPVLADQFQRDSFLVTPDISLGVPGNVLQAVFKGIQNSDGADGVCSGMAVTVQTCPLSGGGYSYPVTQDGIGGTLPG